MLIFDLIVDVDLAAAEFLELALQLSDGGDLPTVLGLVQAVLRLEVPQRRLLQVRLHLAPLQVTFQGGKLVQEGPLHVLQLGDPKENDDKLNGLLVNIVFLVEEGLAIVHLSLELGPLQGEEAQPVVLL